MNVVNQIRNLHSNRHGQTSRASCSTLRRESGASDGRSCAHEQVKPHHLFGVLPNIAHASRDRVFEF
jgi:hypothetical protein